MGKYELALADAQFIRSREDTPAARLRVKNLQDYISAKDNCTPGYKNAHVTLLCGLTPKELRQWRASGPSVYSI